MTEVTLIAAYVAIAAVTMVMAVYGMAKEWDADVDGEWHWTGAIVAIGAGAVWPLYILAAVTLYLFTMLRFVPPPFTRLFKYFREMQG